MRNGGVSEVSRGNYEEKKKRMVNMSHLSIR